MYDAGLYDPLDEEDEVCRVDEHAAVSRKMPSFVGKRLNGGVSAETLSTHFYFSPIKDFPFC